jgi:hypothetical protein
MPARIEITKHLENKIIYLRIKKKFTCKKIALKLNCSEGFIYKFLIKRGIMKAKKVKSRRVLSTYEGFIIQRYPQEQAEKIIKEYRQNKKRKIFNFSNFTL